MSQTDIRYARLLKPGEVCQILRVSSGTLRNWSRRYPEKIEVFRTAGGHRRFRYDQIMKLAAEGWDGPRSG